MTKNAVLGVPAERVKLSMRSDGMLPALALVDPELTHTLPSEPPGCRELKRGYIRCRYPVQERLQVDWQKTDSDAGPSPIRVQSYTAFAALHAAMACVFLMDRSSGTDAAWRGLPLDDGFIHLVYAHSLSLLEGLAYNPGQLETGITSPLWAFLLAPCFWLSEILGGDIVLWAKALGLSIAFATSILVFELVLRLRGCRATALLAGGLVALDPSLAFAKLSGMEVWLAAAIVLAALLALQQRRIAWLAIALGLAPMARPENALFLLLFIPAALSLLRERGYRPADVLSLATPGLLVGALWLTHALIATGRPLPGTFYAKHGSATFESLLSNLSTLFGSMLFSLPWFELGVGFLLLGLGALVLIRDARASGSTDRWIPILLLLHPPCFLIGLAWAHEFSQDSPFYWNRYFQPIIPFLLISLAIGAMEAFAWLRSSWQRETPRGRAWAAAGAAALVIPLLTLPFAIARSASLYSNNCEDIQQTQVALGKWLAEHADPDDVIAANDAGALRFYSERPVIDLLGLNSEAIRRRGWRTVLWEQRPRFVVIFPTWFPALAESPRLRAVHGVRDDHYTICDCAQDLMVVYEWIDRATDEAPPETAAVEPGRAPQG